jgi:hypothetical protein
MCDYSLHHVASRAAVVGDKLVSTGFSRSGTRGFAAIGEPDVAVCLDPGTELAFGAEVRYEHPFDRLIPGLQFGFVGESLASFRQVNMGRRLAHHDALEFANGQTVLVTRLLPGQRATVLQLPARTPAATGTKERSSEPLTA